MITYSFRTAKNGNKVVRVNKNGIYRWFNSFVDAADWVMNGGIA